MAKSYDKTFEERVAEAIAYPPRPDEERVEISDDVEAGLKLRVWHTGHASWYVYMYDPIVQGKRTKKLGDFSMLTVDQARHEAHERRKHVTLMAASGTSFVTVDVEKKKLREVQKRVDKMTLQGCLDYYCEHTPGLRPRSEDDYRKAITSKLNCPEMLDCSVSEITKAWFMERFTKIYERSPSASWKWRTALHAILLNAYEREPAIFKNGFPIPKRSKMGYNLVRPGRKSKRLQLPFLPEFKQRLKEFDDYDRDFIMLLLLTGMRAGACKRLRYDMICDQKNKEQWEKGVVEIYSSEDDDLTKSERTELVLSKQVQGIILKRKRLYGDKSPWLFWRRQNKLQNRAEDVTQHCAIDGGDKEMFVRLSAPDDEGGTITAHDLRRTFSHIGRVILSIDHLIIAMLQTQSTKNLNVPDGYLGAKYEDLRRATNRISDKFIEWMNSTAEQIKSELKHETVAEEISEFEL